MDDKVKSHLIAYEYLRRTITEFLETVKAMERGSVDISNQQVRKRLETHLYTTELLHNG